MEGSADGAEFGTSELEMLTVVAEVGEGRGEAVEGLVDGTGAEEEGGEEEGGEEEGVGSVLPSRMRWFGRRNHGGKQTV